jgi:hypothetical protein
MKALALSPRTFGERPPQFLAWLGLGGVLVAVGAGLSMLGSKVSPTSAIAGVLAGALFLWLAILARIETVALCLVALVVLQNYLVVDIGFYLLPAYFVTVLLSLRLFLAGRFHIVRTPLNGPVFALLALATASVPVAFLLGPRFPSVLGDVRYSSVRPLVQLGALFLLVLSFIVAVRVFAANRFAYEKALRVLLWVATGVATYALYEQAAYFLGLPSLEFLAGEDAREALFSLGTPAPTLFRSSATFIEPLNLGHFLLGPLALLIAVAPYRARMGRIGRWIVPMIAVQFLALATTFSGGAFGGFLAAIIVLLVVGRPRLRVAGAVLVIGLVGIVTALTTSFLLSGRDADPLALLTVRARQTFEIETLPASASNPYVGFRRTDYWRAAIEIAGQYPLTGAGIGNFGAAAVSVNSALIPIAGSYGVPWGFLGELGVPGVLVLAFFLLRFVQAVGRGSRMYRRTSPELLGYLAGFLGMMVQYVASGYTRMDIHVWVFSALAMAGLRWAELERSQQYLR